jgi:hypothetical protein
MRIVHFVRGHRAISFGPRHLGQRQWKR